MRVDVPQLDRRILRGKMEEGRTANKLISQQKNSLKAYDGAGDDTAVVVLEAADARLVAVQVRGALARVHVPYLYLRVRRAGDQLLVVELRRARQCEPTTATGSRRRSTVTGALTRAKQAWAQA